MTPPSDLDDLHSSRVRIRGWVSSTVSVCPSRERRAMTYREFFSHVVEVVEAVGATIMVVGGLGAFARFVDEVARRRRSEAPTVNCART